MEFILCFVYVFEISRPLAGGPVSGSSPLGYALIVCHSGLYLFTSGLGGEYELWVVPCFTSREDELREPERSDRKQVNL